MAGKKIRRTLTNDERILWDRVTRDLAPLSEAERNYQASRQDDPAAPLAKPIKPAHPKTTKAKPAAAAKTPATPKPSNQPTRSNPSAAAPAPLGRRMVQRLARGAIAIDGRIDLHGLTQRQAHLRLMGFIRDAHARDARVVLVITGKGRTPGPAHEMDGGEGGVLRRAVPQWLRLPEFASYVSGIDQAHLSHGGSGALYVRLRRRRNPAHL